MAYIIYEAKYQEKTSAKDLSEEIIQAIETARKDRKLELKDNSSDNFKKSYLFPLGEDKFLVFGLKALSGPKAGTEQVHFQFSGQDTDILKAKSGLLEKIAGLELE